MERVGLLYCFMSAKTNYKHGTKVSTHEVGGSFKNPSQSCWWIQRNVSHLRSLVGAMLQLLGYQISPVTPLAPLVCSTPTTQTVETVLSSFLFPSPASLPKSTVRDYDDTGSRNFHPKGLVESNICVFQIFVRNLFLFPDILRVLQSLQQAGLRFSWVMSFKGLVLMEAVWLYRQSFGRQPHRCSLKASYAWARAADGPVVQHPQALSLCSCACLL